MEVTSRSLLQMCHERRRAGVLAVAVLTLTFQPTHTCDLVLGDNRTVLCLRFRRTMLIAAGIR